MIPSNIIEEIRNKADIVAIISEYVRLKKRGKNYLGLCPFHSEKDASFTVSPEKNLFHCFGCNEGGNIFAFIMKIENINFVEAVVELGAKLGINVPQAGKNTRSQKSEQDKLYQVVDLAAKYFNSQLDEQAQSYLKTRGITDQTRNLFGLGFAPSSWDNLFKHLIARGGSPSLIEKCGLILAREGQGGYYDRFRNRLIFPIFDHRGRVVAFGGRSLGADEPKYLNSPDTPIYHKGEILFGLNFSKNEIKKSKTAVLVEGYFDLITPLQAGITNIVATLGTALTVYQCKLLSRYCETAILAFDADSAGSVAAERSIELLRNQGLKVKVVTLDYEKDPDELIRKHGSAAFVKCLEEALPFLDFKIKRIASHHNLKEIEGRAKALQQIARLLSQEKDDFIQKEYAKFCATLLASDPDTVLAEIKRMQHYQKSTTRMSSRRKTEKPNSKLAEAEKNLITLAAQNKEALEILKKEMQASDFSLPETRNIADLLLATKFSDDQSPSHFLLENLPEDADRKFLSALLINEHLAEKNQVAAILKDCIKVIKNEQTKIKIGTLKQQIKEAEKTGQAQKVAELLFALKSEIS